MTRNPQHVQKHDVSKPTLEKPCENEPQPWSERSDTTRVILRRMSSDRKRPTILNHPSFDCAATSDQCEPWSAPATLTAMQESKIPTTRHSLVIRNNNTVSRFVFETDFRCSGKCGVCSSTHLDTVFSPCRHIYACHECACVILRTSGVCPVCNHTIVDVDRC